MTKPLSIDPNNKNVINNKAAVLINLGKFDEATKYYQQTLSIDPNDTRILINKGISLEGIKKFDEATKYYDKAINRSK